MRGKIPATVITGFLGAGKTTLIRHLLANAEGRRIALIINEFGDLGVDGGIVQGCGFEDCAEDDVVELPNGCICCTVAEDFLPALTKLLEREVPPDHIVIETSGLALPQPLVRAFAWPDIRAQVTVDGVVTVVDGAAVAAGHFAADEAAVARQRAEADNLDHDTPLAQLFEDQLACADLVLLNKADLLGEETAGALTADLQGRARAGVSVVSAAHGAAPMDVLLGRSMGAEDDMEARVEVHHRHDHDHDHDDDEDHDHDHGHGHDHGHDAFESFIVELSEAESPEAIAERVQQTIAAHGLLRVKGFAAVSGKPMRLVVQAVGPRVSTYFDRPFRPEEERRSALVAIGHAGLDRESIAAALGGYTLQQAAAE